VISAVAASGVTQSSATVTWNTNVAANTQVEYGLTAAYGATTPLGAALTTSHGAALAGLNAGTIYHYAVMSAAGGSAAISADNSFTTPGEPVAPVISVVAAPIVEQSSATVTWLTNEAATSQVEYGLTAAYGATSPLEESLTTSHNVALSGLSAATLYHYAVISNAGGESVTTSADSVFTTAGAAPVLSGVVAYGVGQTSASVSWTTNEPADAQVEYGTSTSYGMTTAPSGVLATSQSAALVGLNPGTLYHYAAISHDASGDPAVSADFSLTTLSTAPPSIGALAAYGVGLTSAVVSWTTNEAADTQVEYGTTAAYGSMTTLSAVFTASHSVVLSGLTAGAMYHYAAMSSDALGNLATSADSTFLMTPAASTTTGVMTAPFVNNFSSSAVNQCFADGSAFGPWTSASAGSGCTQVVSSGAGFWLNESPMVSTVPAAAHSALVLGPAFAAPLAFSAKMATTAQLRKNSAPNPWEVGWVVWDYADSGHFYYFQPATNGWVLGKEDPSYPGSRRVLATGASPAFAVGSWYIVKVVQNQNVLTVYANGSLITTFTDAQTPYSSGNIGFYAQDAAVRIENIAVNASAGAAPPTVSVSIPAAAAGIATVSGTTTILAVTSNDADVSLVQFLLDGAPLGGAVGAPPFAYAWNTALDAPGAHTLSAMLWDAAEDSSVSPGDPIVIANAGAGGLSGDQAKAPQKFLSPALPDGINDVATFGPAATDVSIYNVRGHLVFHGSQQGGTPIVWNCKDGSGRVDESGVYVAKIRTADSGVVYQSFALVK
ncbi:MAG: fibronectin type III domain-containing protein, partial [Elusimicrobiota bacterium]